MDGLRQEEGVSVVVKRLVLVVGVEGVQVGIAQIVEGIAVKMVRAALGDGVDLASGSLSELCRVGGGIRLEFLDGESME
jgi:hypothetical protein